MILVLTTHSKVEIDVLDTSLFTSYKNINIPVPVDPFTSSTFKALIYDLQSYDLKFGFLFINYKVSSLKVVA